MADTIFESYLDHVYRGSGANFFDEEHIDHDIFGGVDPAEIIDELDEFSFEPKPKKCESFEQSIPEESIIGFIQIGMHITPIVDDDADLAGTKKESAIVTPMKLQLHQKPATDAKSIGGLLKTLSSA